MSIWTSQEVTTALALTQTLTYWETRGVSIDTRTLKPGDLYIAIRGETHDGHAFIPEAVAKGAVVAIVDHVVDGVALSYQIVVRDTLKALTQLGAFARARTKATIIAITGSVGKTSTKELLGHVLGAFGVTFASPASYNNHWGLPLSLALMPRNAMYGIFEIGTNHRGEIAPLTSLVCPHISIITAIADAHIGFLGSRQAIAEEKSDIFASSPPPGLAIIHQDNPEFEFMRKRAISCKISKVMSFGKTEGASVQLVHYSYDPERIESTITATISGQELVYMVPQPGEHLATNSLMSIALGDALGLDQKRLITQLATLPAVKGRGKQYRVPISGGDILLIDDAYNANLTSMRAGLDVLAVTSPQANGRRITVLGEMLELGDQAESQHQQLMDSILQHSVDLVFATGGPVIEGAFKRTIPLEKAGGYAACIDELIPLVVNSLRPGDVVFVKGSKGSRVSKVVDALVAQILKEDGIIH